MKKRLRQHKWMITLDSFGIRKIKLEAMREPAVKMLRKSIYIYIYKNENLSYACLNNEKNRYIFYFKK